MPTARIVFIGAGSVSFGLATFRDLFSTSSFSGCTLSLVDTDRGNLERMHELALAMNEAGGAGLRIEKTVERREALPGASFVLNSIAIERNRLWQLDFEVPKRHGIRHTLGENGGPGGLLFTMRTIPLVMDIARDIEELAPQALFLNFSNPESRIILALGRYSRVRALGLCHGVFMGRDSVARILGRRSVDVDVLAAGLNHFQWLLEVRDRVTGDDLSGELRECERTFDPAFQPLSRRLYRTFGRYPSCSDDHIGEYLAWGWEAGEEGYDFAADERWRETLKEEIADRLSLRRPLAEWLSPSGERAGEVMAAVLGNGHRWIESGVVYNQGAIANLPADLAVEVPVVADGAGVHPVVVGELPVGIARLFAAQVAVQQMAVEAAVQGSRELALQALLMDPVVSSGEAAERILDELWEANRPYIRRCV